MATNEKTQKDTAKAKSRTFGRSKQTQKDTAKAESRTFGSSKRAKEEEEEELLVQEEILRNNPMMQPTDLIGQRGQQETGMDTNPLLMGGLGLGGGLVASQTGGAPVTSQVLSPFAQKVAAQDASRMAARNLPQLIGTPQTYQGVPTGPNTLPQFTGTAQARPVPGTQIVPQTQLSTINQSPAVQSSGSLSNKTTTAKPGTANYGVNRTSPYTMGPLKSLLGTLTKGLVGSLAVAPIEMGDATIGGAFNRRVAAGEDPAEVRASLGLDADYGNAQDFGYAVPDATLDATTPVTEAPKNALLDLAEREGALGPKLTDIFQGRAEALSARTENPIDATDPGPVAAPGSPQAIFEEAKKLGLGDRDIAGFEKVAARMGTTFDPVYGFSRDPFLEYQQEQEYLSDRPGYGDAGAANDQYQSADFDTISQGVFDTPMTGMRPINAETGEPLSQAVIDAAARAGLELPMASVPLPQAPVNSIPMGRDETRARLGGMTLNQYLNAPDGAVSGLRTDPQGRMIPGRGRAAQDGVFAYDDMTRADAYGQYEDEVSQAYQRQSERMQQRADQRDGTAGPRTYGGYTTAQLRGMVGGGDNLRAAQMRAEAGLNPVTGNRAKTAEERQISTDILNAQLNKLEKSEPNKYNSAVSEVESLVASGILPADKSREAILSKLGYDLEELLGIDGTGAGGGGGVEVPDSIAGLASQYANKIITGPDGKQYKSDGKSWTVVQ